MFIVVFEAQLCSTNVIKEYEYIFSKSIVKDQDWQMRTCRNLSFFWFIGVISDQKNEARKIKTCQISMPQTSPSPAAPVVGSLIPLSHLVQLLAVTAGCGVYSLAVLPAGTAVSKSGVCKSHLAFQTSAFLTLSFDDTVYYPNFSYVTQFLFLQLLRSIVSHVYFYFLFISSCPQRLCLWTQS